MLAAAAGCVTGPRPHLREPDRLPAELPKRRAIFGEMNRERANATYRPRRLAQIAMRARALYLLSGWAWKISRRRAPRLRCSVRRAFGLGMAGQSARRRLTSCRDRPTRTARDRKLQAPAGRRQWRDLSRNAAADCDPRGSYGTTAR